MGVLVDLVRPGAPSSVLARLACDALIIVIV